MSFYFDPTVFVRAGFEDEVGDYPEETHAAVQPLRRFYPELAAWSDLALSYAWMSYTQAIYAAGSMPSTQRENGFLAFIYVKTKQPGFEFGSVGVYYPEVMSLGEDEPWKTSAALPNWATET